jgi:citrate/tricarballylate utilization protein
MQPLVELIEQAGLDAALGVSVGASVGTAEVSRVMQICNACRYCEGFCAVFPAMTRRLAFDAADAHYLANLCHNCGACLHACQYAPPHEFAVNVPQAMAQVRHLTYQDYAWPAPLGKLYKNNGLTVSLALAFGLALFLLLATALKGTLWPSLDINGPVGNFYAIFPHQLLVNLFGSVFLSSVLCLIVSVVRFWKSAPPLVSSSTSGAYGEALGNVLSLKYLDGGHGDGCNDEDDKSTHRRRQFHHLTFYGFILCFASTSLGTFYHYVLGQHAPYALLSLPVIVGSLGGIGLIIGPLGLFWLKRNRHPLHGDPAQNAMDYGFVALLFFTSLTGMLLTFLRHTDALAILLCVHLGVVMALFLTMPFGKFAHGFYRGAALMKWAIEKRQPSKLRLGD